MCDPRPIAAMGATTTATIAARLATASVWSAPLSRDPSTGGDLWSRGQLSAAQLLGGETARRFVHRCRNPVLGADGGSAGRHHRRQLVVDTPAQRPLLPAERG